jgi:hypothetical protein
VRTGHPGLRSVSFCRFQAFHRLAATGVLDEPTVERMGTPRCGNPDIPRVNVLGFALQGSR